MMPTMGITVPPSSNINRRVPRNKTGSLPRGMHVPTIEKLIISVQLMKYVWHSVVVATGDGGAIATLTLSNDKFSPLRPVISTNRIFV